MDELTREEKLILYNKIVHNDYKGLDSNYKYIYDVISQFDSISKYNEIFNSEDDKIAFMDQILETAKKVFDKWGYLSLKHISFIIMNERISNNGVNDLLLLTFFPEECFKSEDEKEKIETYNKYLYLIETLIIYEDGYSASLLKDTKLFNYINEYLEYKYVCKVYSYDELANNVFIPSIILYCLKNNLSHEEFINMVNKAIDNYEKLLNYLELNDDKKHDFELNQMLINKLLNISNEKVLR